MSKNLRKCLRKMHHFCDFKSKNLKKNLLNEMCGDDCFFEAIYEIVNNIKCGCVRVPRNKKKLFKPRHLNVMDKIIKRPKSKAIRKKLVRQSGGFLPYILPIITPIIIELIQNAISKKSDTNPT